MFTVVYLCFCEIKVIYESFDIVILEILKNYGILK